MGIYEDIGIVKVQGSDVSPGELWPGLYGKTDRNNFLALLALGDTLGTIIKSEEAGDLPLNINGFTETVKKFAAAAVPPFEGEGLDYIIDGACEAYFRSDRFQQEEIKSFFSSEEGAA